MAKCLLLDVTVVGTAGAAWPASAVYPTNPLKQLPWVLVDATVTQSGNSVSYTCASGTHLLLTPDEVNAASAVVSIKTDPIDTARVQDMYALFLALLAVLVTVWGGKQLMRLFTGDTDKD